MMVVHNCNLSQRFLSSRPQTSFNSYLTNSFYNYATWKMFSSRIKDNSKSIENSSLRDIIKRNSPRRSRGNCYRVKTKLFVLYFILQLLFRFLFYSKASVSPDKSIHFGRLDLIIVIHNNLFLELT